MSTKRSLVFAERGNRSVMNMVLFTTIILVGIAVTSAVGIGIWNRWQTDRYSVVQDSRLGTTNNRVEQAETDISTLNTELGNVNTTVCNKITTVNTTLQTQINDINDELNITGISGMSFRENVTQELEIVNNDVDILEINLNNLTSEVNILDMEAVKTINMQGPMANNMNIIAGNSGIGVSQTMYTTILNNTGVTALISGQGVDVNVANGDVTVSNTGIITLNMISANSIGEFFISGSSGITISPGPSPNEVTINGTSLTNSINNVIMVNAVQNMDIMNLTTVINNQQMEINVLQQTIIILGQMINGTEMDFNMTLTQLIMDVLTLQQDVVVLQDQIQNASSLVLPTGTIVPWGGADGVMIPTGYALCDGSMLDKVANVELFDQIQCTYCVGMVCTLTDFCLPDLRGTIPVGKKAGGGIFDAVEGVVVGAETHILLSNEMPVHSHSIGSDGSHSHDVILGNAQRYISGSPAHSECMGGLVRCKNTATAVGQDSWCLSSTSGLPCTHLGQNDGNYWLFPMANGVANLPYGHGATPNGAHTHGGATGSAGSGMPHTIVQTSMVIAGYIIKL